MQRYSKLWWASILLSSVVTGGSSFVLLVSLTELSVVTAFAMSLMIILTADIALALIMQSVSPTRVTVGPGERRHAKDAPSDRGAVIGDFEDRQGKVSVRGEIWQARQANDCNRWLGKGATVRVVERDRLTFVVTGDAAEPQRTNKQTAA